MDTITSIQSAIAIAKANGDNIVASDLQLLTSKHYPGNTAKSSPTRVIKRHVVGSNKKKLNTTPTKKAVAPRVDEFKALQTEKAKNAGLESARQKMLDMDFAQWKELYGNRKAMKDYFKNTFGMPKPRGNSSDMNYESLVRQFLAKGADQGEEE